jgi:hypothetical protein
VRSDLRWVVRLRGRAISEMLGGNASGKAEQYPQELSAKRHAPLSLTWWLPLQNLHPIISR